VDASWPNRLSAGDVTRFRSLFAAGAMCSTITRSVRPPALSASEDEHLLSQQLVKWFPEKIFKLQAQERGRYHAFAKERIMLLRCESLEPPMSQLGHSRRSCFGRESGYPQKPDILGARFIRREWDGPAVLVPRTAHTVGFGAFEEREEQPPWRARESPQ
jgi:hypothetical protein